MSFVLLRPPEILWRWDQTLRGGRQSWRPLPEVSGGRGIENYGRRDSEGSLGEEALFPTCWPASSPAILWKWLKFFSLLILRKFWPTYNIRRRNVAIVSQNDRSRLSISVCLPEELIVLKEVDPRVCKWIRKRSWFWAWSSCWCMPVSCG